MVKNLESSSLKLYFLKLLYFQVLKLMSNVASLFIIMFDIEDLLLISEIYGKLLYHHDEEFNVSICSVG